jgi:hypothetical protein
MYSVPQKKFEIGRLPDPHPWCAFSANEGGRAFLEPASQYCAINVYIRSYMYIVYVYILWYSLELDASVFGDA